MSTITDTVVRLSPAEAAQVVERVIAIAEDEFGYGTQAREIIGRAIAEVKGESGGTATDEPGTTSLTTPVRALTTDDLAENTGDRPTLTERVEALEALAKRHLGVDPY